MSVAETLTLAKTLKPKLGEKATAELITFIEEYKHETLATKDDLKGLEIRLRKEINEVRKEVNEIRKEMVALRKDMNANTWKLLGSIALMLSIFTAILKLA